MFTLPIDICSQNFEAFWRVGKVKFIIVFIIVITVNIDIITTIFDATNQ